MSERNDKNAIFGSSEVSPAATAEARVRADMGLDIPVEMVPLPSRGKCYPPGHPLHNRDTVEIRPMTAREEDILSSQALIKNGTVMSALLRSCLHDRSINPLSLLSADRNALMIAIRVTGYGPEYDVKLKCPACEAEFEHTFMLNRLPIKWLELEPVQPSANQFAFQLPVSGKDVVFQFSTGKDEEEIQQNMTAAKKKIGLAADVAVTTALRYALISIGSETEKGKIAQFIQNMPARDSLKLREYMKKHEPGIEMKQSSVCTYCQHEEEVEIPMGLGFFWPHLAK